MIAPTPRRYAADAVDLDARAAMLALMSPDAIDRLVAAEAAAAVREHRIEDAVCWHRVRLRALRLRAATSACRA